MPTMNNVIVLTIGLSGSSVLTGLLSKAGYWMGSTVRKPDYDTYENQELVELNRMILQAADFTGRYEMVYDPAFVEQVTNAAGKLDSAPFIDFIERCDRHGPWIWKDPRLWLTIRIWRHWLDLSKLKFVVLERDPLQTWISTTIRRQIQTRAYSDKYLGDVRGSIDSFIDETAASRLKVVYEDLLVAPEATIDRINAFLGTRLTTNDLKAVYKGRLYKKPHGIADLVKANMIYLKNYGERYR
jgi:hypothetical protein